MLCPGASAARPSRTRSERGWNLVGTVFLMNALVLWDVDHTLIENGGVSKETYAGAFELLTGRTAEHRAKTGGRTDPEILGDLLADHGYDRAAYTDTQMAEALTESLRSRRSALEVRGHALPGGRAAIDALAQIPGVVQGVLTGNVQANAIGKLAAFDLDRGLDWDCGGFGFDAPRRWDLVGVAQARGAAKYDVAFTETNTVLIGDTLNDVSAGLRGGAKVIAVATGSDDMEALRDAGATLVLPDLKDTDAVLEAVAKAVSSESYDIG